MAKKEKKYYTVEEAKEHGRIFIDEQAEILRKKLREKKEIANSPLNV